MSRLTASIFALADGAPPSSPSSRPARAEPSQSPGRHTSAHIRKASSTSTKYDGEPAGVEVASAHFRPVRVQGHVWVTLEGITASFHAPTVGAQSSCAAQCSGGKSMVWRYRQVWLCALVAFSLIGITPRPAQAMNEYSKAEIAEWRRACQQDDGEACRQLGLVHDDGNGVRKDIAAAKALYRKACGLGNAGGCSNLAFVLIDEGAAAGSGAAEVERLLVRGCELGGAGACWGLGRRLRQGLGVNLAAADALRFYERACRLGSSYGCQQAAQLGGTQQPARTAPARPVLAPPARPVQPATANNARKSAPFSQEGIRPASESAAILGSWFLGAASAVISEQSKNVAAAQHASNANAKRAISRKDNISACAKIENQSRNYQKTESVMGLDRTTTHSYMVRVVKNVCDHAITVDLSATEEVILDPEDYFTLEGDYKVRGVKAHIYPN